MPARIACLVVPDLPLQALLRSEPELRGRPVAVTEARAEGREPKGRRVPSAPAPTRTTATTATKKRSEPALTSRVIAVSIEAAARGVAVGQTAAQARATEPSLVLRAAHPEQCAAARAALFDAGLGFAPRVEPRGDSIFLDVGDLGRLYAREEEVALALRARAQRVGLEVGVGIAAGKGIARVAAGWACVLASATEEQAVREVMHTKHTQHTHQSKTASATPHHADVGADGLCMVPAGGEARFLSPLPVAALASAVTLDDKSVAEALSALARWGVFDCGRLARLPAREVSLRLGPAGALFHRLAEGRSSEPLAPRAPTDECEEGLDLDWPIDDLEALAFVLRGLIDRLLARLGARRLACGGMALRLRLDDGASDPREIAVAAPTSDAASLLTLARLSLEKRPPSAAVVNVTLLGRAACARPDQLDLFRPPGPAPDRLATTVAKLQALLGDDAVGTPREVDTHREEAIAVGPLALGRAVAAKAAGKVDPSAFSNPVVAADPVAHVAQVAALAFRRFRPEPEMEVIVDGGAMPRAMSGPGLSCRLLVAAGPFRAQGEWWTEEAFCRDYWDVHASDGALYRIYRTQRSHLGDVDQRERWFLAGYYD